MLGVGLLQTHLKEMDREMEAEMQTLNLRPCKPVTDLTTDLMVSHFMRLKRSIQRQSMYS